MKYSVGVIECCKTHRVTHADKVPYTYQLCCGLQWGGYASDPIRIGSILIQRLDQLPELSCTTCRVVAVWDTILKLIL
jgi:hypothetical protein